MAENENSSAAEKLTYLLIGGGIGATLALLFAPKAGRELRDDIADYTRRGIDKAGEGARNLGERAGEVYETGRGKVTETYGAVREKVAQGADAVTEIGVRQKDQITAAIEAGKQAYREEKRRLGEVGRAATEGDEP
jgi:gas vesicle protein